MSVEENNKSIVGQALSSQAFWRALILSSLFPLVSWVLEIVRSQVSFSLSGIVQIHKANPVLWIVDLIPLLVVLLVYMIDRKLNHEKQKFDSQIQERDARLNAMAGFSKQIGEGNYNAKLDLTSEKDILGQSLLLMRDNLLTNHKKESEENWIAAGKEKISMSHNPHCDVKAHD